MFSLCLINIRIINKNSTQNCLFTNVGKNSKITKLHATDVRHETEEILVMINIIIQTTAVNRKNNQEIEAIVPKYVAIPFPPLNFNQIGKICPIVGAARISKLQHSDSVDKK